MNTRPIIETANEQPALSVAFNDDSSRFAVGLDSGFCSTLAFYSSLYCLHLHLQLTLP